MDPYNLRDRKAFIEAHTFHRRACEPFRATRTALVKDLAGAFFGDMRDIAALSQGAHVVNLMLQLVESVLMSIASGTPRYLITAKSSQKSGFAQHYQLALNNLAQEIHLGQTLQDCALDAVFGLSVCKVHLADAPPVEIEADVWMDPGRPFASRVSLDDFCFDTSEPDFRKARFASDRYRICYEDLIDPNGKFEVTREMMEVIRPTSRRDISADSDLARDIGYGNRNDEGEFESKVDLIDVYLPREGKIVTWACTGNMKIVNTDPVSVYDWDGDETGPYHLLNLAPVPEHVMPTSPAQNAKFLINLVNSLYKKMSKQAEAQKTINVVDPSASESVENIKKTSDNGWATAETTGLGLFRTGGVDQQTWQFASSIIDLFDRMGGNISASMGLGAQSETATQDQMIMGQVSRHESFLQERFVSFAAGVGEHLGYLMYTDPVLELPGRRHIPGTDYEFSSNWTPDYREGSFPEYDIKTDPYFMVHRSPSERAQVLNRLAQELLPLMPALMQQGWQFDAGKYVEIMAELRDAPRLREIFKPVMPDPNSQATGGAHQATQSPFTRRETVRTGAGGTGGAVMQAPQAPSQQQGMVGVA